MNEFNILSFLLRFAFAIVLVFATFNPTGYSFFHWVYNTLPGFKPQIGLVGILLVVGWIIFIRASVRSIGFIGFNLLALFFVFSIWLMIDLGWFSLKGNVTAISWISEFCLAFIMAVGISWSHIRRRITGQVDVDDVDQ